MYMVEKAILHCLFCRQADQDMVVGGYRIPKGTAIQMPSYAMHMSAANFIQPYLFWPERWQQGTDQSSFSEDPGRSLLMLAVQKW